MASSQETTVFQDPTESDCVRVGSDSWVTGILDRPNLAECATIGLISGSRENNDLRCVVSLAEQLSQCVASRQLDSRLLVLRLDVFHSNLVDRLIDQPDRIPTSSRSPIGNWKEVMVPMPVGEAASWSLLQLPNWIATWRKQFDLILMDLGPIDLVPARVVGRLCWANYLLLGPNEAGSRSWLMKHIELLAETRVPLAGSLVATIENQQAA